MVKFVGINITAGIAATAPQVRIDEHFGAKGVEGNAKQVAILHLSLKGKPKTIFRSLRRLSQQASKLLNPHLVPHLNPHLNPQNQLFNSNRSPLIDANAFQKLIRTSCHRIKHRWLLLATHFQKAFKPYVVGYKTANLPKK